MITRDEIKQLQVNEASLQTRISVSAIQVIISLSRASDTVPISRLWRLLSLLLVSLAGALGGALYSLTDQLRHVGSTEKLLAGFINLLF